MAKVLVVGGAGYVGSQTAKSLRKAGHEVVVLDNLSTGFRELAVFGRLVEGDIRDRPFVSGLLEKEKPDAVMHFAAKALVGESVADPLAYYDCNVKGSVELLAALQAQRKKPVLVFSSTCSLYGAADRPLREEDPIAPLNPYARSKRMVEEILADADAAYGLRYVCLRYFNAAGCDPEGEVGELHEPESHLIPRLLLHALDPEGYPVKIFGGDYPTADGTCVRDYVHVEDLAAAHISAMDHLRNGGASDIFNLGTTQGSSVREVVRMVEKVTGAKLDIPVGPRRAGDPPLLVAGSRKAAELLQWAPAHDLESIVRTAWAWAKKRRAAR
jgi:UDP-glucose-4-epimerase GalE